MLVVCASTVGVLLMPKAVVGWLWVVWLPGVAGVVSRCLRVVSVGDSPVEGLWVWVCVCVPPWCWEVEAEACWLRLETVVVEGVVRWVWASKWVLLLGGSTVHVVTRGGVGVVSAAAVALWVSSSTSVTWVLCVEALGVVAWASVAGLGVSGVKGG